MNRVTPTLCQQIDNVLEKTREEEQGPMFSLASQKLFPQRRPYCYGRSPTISYTLFAIPYTLLQGSNQYPRWNTGRVQQLKSLLEDLEAHPYRHQIVALAKTALLVAVLVVAFLARRFSFPIPLLTKLAYVLLSCRFFEEAGRKSGNPTEDETNYPTETAILALFSIAAALGGGLVGPMYEAIHRQGRIEELAEKELRALEETLTKYAQAAIEFAKDGEIGKIEAWCNQRKSEAFDEDQASLYDQILEKCEAIKQKYDTKQSAQPSA